MNVVARLWTFSTKARCLTVDGDHVLEQYSRCGRTREQKISYRVLISVISLQTRFTNPSFRFALETISSIRLPHCKSQDITMPRSLIKGTHSRYSEPNRYDQQLLGIRFFEIWRALHFRTLKDMLESKLHRWRPLRSCWRRDCEDGESQSSANSAKFESEWI
jgi:hypothetical protein